MVSSVKFSCVFKMILFLKILLGLEIWNGVCFCFVLFYVCVWFYFVGVFLGGFVLLFFLQTE